MISSNYKFLPCKKWLWTQKISNTFGWEKKKFPTCEIQTAHFLKAHVNGHRWERKGLTIQKEKQRTCAESSKFIEKWVTVAFKHKKGAYSHCWKKCELKLLWDSLYTYYINLAKKRRLSAHTLRMRNKHSAFAALLGRGGII